MDVLVELFLPRSLSIHTESYSSKISTLFILFIHLFIYFIFSLSQTLFCILLSLYQQRVGKKYLFLDFVEKD